MSRLTKDQSIQLDSVRGISALVVLLGHANQTFLLPTLKTGASIVGLFTQMSVMVFFVLSGFLIGKSIINNRARNGIFDADQYAMDRAIRILPPLVISLALMWALFLAAPHFFPSGTFRFLDMAGVKLARPNFSTNIEQTIGALFFTNGFLTSTPYPNGPLWSLSFEVWYYAIAALLFTIRSNRFVSVLGLAFILLLTSSNAEFYLLAPIWFAGFGLAFIHNANANMNNKVFAPLAIIFGAITIACIWSVLNIPDSRSPFKSPWVYYKLSSGLWFACMMALMLGGALRFTTILSRTAGFAYTLYITHFPIMLFVLGCSQNYIVGSISNSLIVAAATIGFIVFFSYHVSKFSENKKLLEKIIQKIPTPGVGYQKP